MTYVDPEDGITKNLQDAYDDYKVATDPTQVPPPDAAKISEARKALVEKIRLYDNQGATGMLKSEFAQALTALDRTPEYVAVTTARAEYGNITNQILMMEHTLGSMPALRQALDAAIADPTSSNAVYNALREAHLALGSQEQPVGSDLWFFPDGRQDFLGIGENIMEFFIPATAPIAVGNCPVVAYDPNDPNQKAEIEQIIKDWPDSAFAKSYERSLETGQPTIYTWFDAQVGKRYYACIEDLTLSAESPYDPEHPSENQERLTQYNAVSHKKKIETIQKAFVDFNDQGRAETIRFEDSSQVFKLHTETIIDEDAYNSAMNQYTYDVKMYENRIEEINAKTKIIQEQDRTLELRLKQLDTEQKALQTEMEAVKKVIDKNVESTFKTFE
jgi:hypothetical protein